MYEKHFLMKETDARKYAVDGIHFFDSEENLVCEEIGDGNVNYVFRVRDCKTGRSVIIKQSDLYFRSNDQPLDPRHNRAEAGILAIEGKYTPSVVPKVYDYNENMLAIAMEDIGEYRNTRKAMLSGEIFPTYTDDITDFMVKTLLPTTDLVMDPQEKKALVERFINPVLCEVTERLVLSDPFGGPNTGNRLTKGNEAFVKEHLYDDADLIREVAILRNNFMNNAQALLHGDLHSGSIFGNSKGLKVIDPEFAFFGPIGYDSGNVIGNLFFELAYWKFSGKSNPEMVSWLRATIPGIFDGFFRKFSAEYDRQVVHPFYRAKGFKDYYIKSIMEDTLGYAGTEMARRTVGAYKVAEIDAVTDPDRRIPMERALLNTAVDLIKNRSLICDGKTVLETFDRRA